VFTAQYALNPNTKLTIYERKYEGKKKIEKRTECFLAEMKAERDEGGGRILLGDNAGGGAVVLLVLLLLNMYP
jgi:hypothetical protein